MTLQELKTQRKEEAKMRRAKEKEARQIAKYENQAYVDAEVARETRDDNIQKLEGITSALNDIPTVSLPTIGKVSVNCFAPTSVFGKELGLLLGIVSTLKFLYVDEQVDEAYAITGTTPIMVEDLGNAIGEPAYFNKNTGIKRDEEVGNYADIIDLLEDFGDDLGVDIDISRFTQSKYTKWFDTKADQAQKKEDAYKEMLRLNESCGFEIDEAEEEE